MCRRAEAAARDEVEEAGACHLDLEELYHIISLACDPPLAYGLREVKVEVQQL